MTKTEEIGSIRAGQAAENVVTFGIRWYATLYIICPILFVLGIPLFYIFGVEAASMYVMVIFAVCVLWILLLILKKIAGIFSGSAETIVRNAIEARYPDQSQYFFHKLYKQGNWPEVLRDNAEEFKTDPESFYQCMGHAIESGKKEKIYDDKDAIWTAEWNEKYRKGLHDFQLNPEV